MLAAVAAFVLAADAISKALVVAHLREDQPVHLIGNVLMLWLTRNPGAAFSVGTGETVVFTVIAFGVIVYIARTARKLYSLGWAIALGLLLGGAMGNLSDRIFRAPGLFRGDVVDWIAVTRFYPIFNLADSAIVCGGILTVILAMRGQHLDGTRGDAAPAPAPAARRRTPIGPIGRIRAGRGAVPDGRGAVSSGERLVYVPEGLDGERLDAAIARMFGVSRTGAAELIGDGKVLIDGKPTVKSDRVTAGAELSVTLPPPPGAAAPTVRAEPVPGLAIVYEDDDIIVVDKPRGVAAHPTTGWTGPTVTGGLLGAGYRVATSGAAERQGIVHRLDANTTGLMVVAKSESAYSALKQAFRERTVSKTYHALIQGHPDPLARHDRRADRPAPVGRRPVRRRRRRPPLGDALRHPRGVPRGDPGDRRPGDRPHPPDPRPHDRHPPPLLRRPPLRGGPEARRPPGPDPAVAARGPARVRAPVDRPRGHLRVGLRPRPPARPRRPGGRKLTSSVRISPRRWRGSNGTMWGVEISAHIDALERDGALLADAAEAAGLQAAVPGCPGWQVRDLVRHQAYVHDWAARHVRDRSPELIDDGITESDILARGPADADLVAAYRDGHAALVAALRDADPDLECATFMPAPSPLAFWARRQAHETAIHRYDAQSAAAGRPAAPGRRVRPGLRRRRRRRADHGLRRQKALPPAATAAASGR